MNTPLQQSHNSPKQDHTMILKHILENVILDSDPGIPGTLAIALEQRGCQSILDVMALSPWEVETLQWTDGAEPMTTLPRGPRASVVSLQLFVLSLHPIPNSMTTTEWLALTEGQYNEYIRSIPYLLVRWNWKRPEPPPRATENGEQLQNWGALDLIESFDVDEFQAAMLRSSEPSSCCMKGEDTTPKDDPIIKALELAIAFFETFCVEANFEAHAMNESQPCATVEPDEPVLAAPTKPTTTDKENPHYHSCAPAEKDAMVHIEYPDRTKFVASMNHEQYEELESYYDHVDVCVVSDTLCPMVLLHVCDDRPHSRCWGVTEFP